MTSRPIITALALVSSVFAAAQTPGKNREGLSSHTKPTPDEVTQALNSETPTASTGNPSEADDSTNSPTQPAQTWVAIAPNQKTKPLENGIVPRVEILNAGNTPVDPTKVTIQTPYPAKPLTAAPAGWHLSPSESAPSFTHEVELSRGAKVTLTIKPHVLLADSDGSSIFAVPEPGYQHALGDRQTTTFGAILATSIRQLDDDCIKLGGAIDNLQQLLISLPKPEVPAPAPTAAPFRKK